MILEWSRSRQLAISRSFALWVNHAITSKFTTTTCGTYGVLEPKQRYSESECRRARDAKRDIPVPLSPCARATTCTCRGRPAPGPRLRHFAPPPDPYDEWLDGVSDALASGLRQLRDLRPLRHFGQPLAPTPTADYPPRASRFPSGQRKRKKSLDLFPLITLWYL